MNNDNLNGFFNIYKPKGITSFDVCNKVKKILGVKKVGHSGTLDPNATGVMQVAVGKATKLLPILEDHVKVYLATMQFGILTDTLDPEGKVIARSDSFNFDEKDLDHALCAVSQYSTQIPPMYSAIKVNGKKLYEYAREGKEVELKPRDVTIYDVERTTPLYCDESEPFLGGGEFQYAKVKLKVSKGFYVRSFVRDVAEFLNDIAIMSDLVRLEIGDYKIEDSVNLEDLTVDNLITIEDTFKSLEKLEVKDYLLPLIKNGMTLDERQIETDKPFLVYNNDKLIAIYQPYETNKYKIVQYLGD